MTKSGGTKFLKLVTLEISGGICTKFLLSFSGPPPVGYPPQQHEYHYGQYGQDDYVSVDTMSMQQQQHQMHQHHQHFIQQQVTIWSSNKTSFLMSNGNHFVRRNIFFVWPNVNGISSFYSTVWTRWPWRRRPPRPPALSSRVTPAEGDRLWSDEEGGPSGEEGPRFIITIITITRK